MVFAVTGTLSEQITDYIIEKIVCLELKPGEKILEKDIVQDLGVSRSPIREALRALEKTGLVEIIPRHGAKVSGMSEEDIDAYYEVFILLFKHVVQR